MLNRIFGGSPLAVLVRLALVSVLVGAAMTWLDIDPWDVIAGLERAAEHLWATGFVGLRQLWRYLLAGGAIVVPVWILLRFLSFRAVPPPPRPSRWQPLPGAPGDPVRTERTD